MSSNAGPSMPRRNWNEVWASRDVRQLQNIPTNPLGLCGCSICGQPRYVTGRVFRQHMLSLHGLKASPIKRLRQLTPDPSPQLPDLPSPAVFDESPLPDDTMDFKFDHAEGVTEEADSREEAAEEGREGEEEGDEVAEGGEEAEDALEPASLPHLAEMSALMEYADDPAYDLPSIHTGTSVHTRTPSPTSPRTQSLGPFIAPELPPNDPLHRWPFYIPLSMRQPEYSGARLNPHFVAESSAHELPVLQRLLPVLALVLSGVFNVARRPVELVLQATSAIVRYAEKVQYSRFKQWYIDNHPNANALLLQDLDLLDPSFDPPAAPATATTALRHISVETALLVHPLCRNPDCSHVFLDITARESFSDLPVLCPDCKTPTRNAKGEPAVLHFPRRSLKSELEVVFRVPGVEQAIERRAQRKKQRDLEDQAGGQQPWGKVYRQQDDGSAWREDIEDANRRSLSVTVNFGIDWANLSSRRSAANDSIGPITLQIADLPAQLRSSFSCAMIMGITPGPKAPKAKNLYKLLVPLVMELRDAESNGIWLRTPSYPQGRLVHVHLGCICCDRPAAVDVTGGPSFSAKATPCLRCTIPSSSITDLSSYPHPARDSSAHSTALLEQITSVPLAVEADRQLHADEQEELALQGKRRRPYPKYREEAATKAATLVTGNISSLSLLPGYDKFAMAVFDPMHSLLEGAVRTYMHKVLVLGDHGSGGDTDRAEGMSGGETDYASDTDARHAQTIAERVVNQLDRGEPVASTPDELAVLRKGISRLGSAAKKPRTKKMTTKDMDSLHEIIGCVQIPISVPRLHAKFGTPTAGTPTANHWRAFATIYGPLSIPRLFWQKGRLEGQEGGNSHLSSSELKALMMLFELVTLSLRSSISEKQVVKLETLVRSFQSLAFALHPTLSASTNLHVISHLGEDIRKFGPTYGWWTFLIERINYVIKNTNQSGGNHFQAAVIGLRAAVKAREVVSARMRVLVTTQDNTEEDKTVVEELLDLFDSADHEAAADSLEQVSVRYAEIEKRKLSDLGFYSMSRIAIKPRGKRVDRSLDDIMLRRLQLCLDRWNISTRSLLDQSPDHSLPYVPVQATFWEGIIYGGRRLDAAEWDKPLQLSVSSFEATELVSRRNSLFESRRSAWIFNCEDARVASGVLCAVFEHALVLPDGQRGESRLFGIVRKLKAFEGEDVYGYRSHPALGVWLWEIDDLEEATIILLTDSTIDTLRPLAITRLPQSFDKKGKAGDAEVWATIPIHHH